MRLSPRIRRVLVTATVVSGLVIANGDAEAQTLSHPPEQFLTTGLIDCGGLDEAPCPEGSFFDLSNGDVCDRGLVKSGNACVIGGDMSRRRKQGVGEKFALTWPGRALRIQRQDLNWTTSIGRLSLPGVHNAFNNDADGYSVPNQRYSMTELLDAGFRQFEWDVHSQNSNISVGPMPQLCHGASSDVFHAGCIPSDRDAVNIVKELRDWMLEPGHGNEVVFITIEDRMNTGRELFNNALREYLDRAEIGLFTTADLEAYVAGRLGLPDERTRPCSTCESTHRDLPSQEWLVSHNKRVIVGVDLPLGLNMKQDSRAEFMGLYAFQLTRNEWTTGGWPYPDCSAKFGSGRWTMWPNSAVTYDVYGDFTDSLTFGQVRELTECNVDQVKFDFMLDEDRPDTANLPIAAIWSWAVGEPPLGAGSLATIMARGNGRWRAGQLADERPFLCKKEVLFENDYLLNVPTNEWATTSARGTFDEGHAACRAHGVGWEFAAPRNGYDNRKARETTVNAGKDPFINFITYGDDRWMEMPAPVEIPDGFPPIALLFGTTELRSGDIGHYALYGAATENNPVTIASITCGAGAPSSQGPAPEGGDFIIVNPSVAVGFDCVMPPDQHQMIVSATLRDINGHSVRSIIVDRIPGTPPTAFLSGPTALLPGETRFYSIDGQSTENDTVTLVSVSCGSGTLMSQTDHTFPGRVFTSFECQFPANQPYMVVSATVRDIDGETSRQRVVYNNTAPAVTLNGPNQSSVGLKERFSFSAHSANGGPLTLLPANCGENGIIAGGPAITSVGNGDTQFVLLCRFTGKNPANIVAVSFKDDLGNINIATLSVNVKGTPPAATIEGPTQLEINDTGHYVVHGRGTDGDAISIVGALCNGSAVPTSSTAVNAKDVDLSFDCQFPAGRQTISIQATLRDSDGDVTVSLVVDNNSLPEVTVDGPGQTTIGRVERYYFSGHSVNGGPLTLLPASCGTKGVITAGPAIVSVGEGDTRYGVNCRFTAKSTAAEPNYVTVAFKDDTGREQLGRTPVVIAGEKPDGSLTGPTEADPGVVLYTIEGHATEDDTVTILDVSCGGAAPRTQSANTAQSPNLTVAFECDFPSPGTFLVNVTLHDVDGDVSESMSVAVKDTMPPTLTIDDVEVTGADPAVAGAIAHFVTVAQDNIGVAGIDCTHLSGSLFPFGVTTVSCTAADAAGNETPASFFVTVLDGVAPVVTVPADLTREATGPGGNPITFKTSASDNVSESLGTTCTTASGSTFAIRTTPVTCTATDAAGNTGSASFNVTVEDTIAPTVTYTGNALIYRIDQNIDIRCSATDGGSGVVSTTCADIVGPAHAFALGSGNNYSATATDRSGNTGGATASFTVNASTATLQTLVSRFSTKADVTSGLNAKLAAAATAPNANARAGQLGAFENQVRAQTGKALTSEQAAILLRLAAALK